jgi:hypothetical protein
MAHTAEGLLQQALGQSTSGMVMMPTQTPATAPLLAQVPTKHVQGTTQKLQRLVAQTQEALTAAKATEQDTATLEASGQARKKCRRGTPGNSTKRIPPSRNSTQPAPMDEEKAAAFDVQFGVITQAKPKGLRWLIFGNGGPGGLQQDLESAIQAKRHFIDQWDPSLAGARSNLTGPTSQSTNGGKSSFDQNTSYDM